MMVISLLIMFLKNFKKTIVIGEKNSKYTKNYKDNK